MADSFDSSGDVETYAKSPGDSVYDVLSRDKVPPRAHYLKSSYVYMGSDDISVDRYFSKEWHDREVEKVWKKTWQVACREEDLPEPGDYIVYDIVHDSVLLTRLQDGSIVAYINACLHRGNELCVGQGRAKAFRCPFHGFTWSLEGKLRYVPSDWDFPHLDRTKFSLPEVKVGRWGGFVFVNLDPDAGPLEDYLEVIPGHLDGDALADRYKAAHFSQIVPANWKLVQEAFIEGYHVAETHYEKDEDGRVDPMGIAAFSHDTAVQYDVWPDVKHVDRLVLVSGVPSQHVAHRIEDEQAVVDSMLRRLPKEARPTVQPGERARDALAAFFRVTLGKMHRKDLAAVSDSELLDQIQYNVFPNFTIWPTVAAPLCYRFRPCGDDPNRSIFEVWFLYPKPDEGPAPAAAKEHRLAEGELWASRAELGPYGPIIDQDIPNLVRLQRGVRATRKPGITLGNYQEVRIRRFHKVLEEYLAR
jgi:phenylpropionate dioxygenase-like ring-hydroxylating dioxygenase large terminal subunit